MLIDNIRADSMRTRFLRVLACGFGLSVALTASAEPPVPEILYYKFNESGTTVTNYASAPPAGTATATIVGSSFSQNNSFSATAQSLVGNGTTALTDYVNTNWATNLTGSWTLSFFTSNIVPSGTLWYILGDINAGSFRCFTNGVAGANNWILRGPISDVLVTGGATTSQHMTTFVYDQALGNIKAYLDGVLVNTVTQASGSVVGAGPFKVGGYASSASLNGNMADFRLYSRALTQSEITDIYNYILHTYYVGGTASGVTRTGLVLQNNAGDDLPVDADGTFTFATPLLDGSAYDVSVSAQPPGLQCTVGNGSGNVASANVTDISVSCVDSPTDLVLTVDDGSNYVQYGQPVNYLVTLTNNGGTTASSVAVASVATGLDVAAATWNCTPGGGATCAASGTGPFGDIVTVPFGGTLSWIVGMPALLTGDSTEFDVTAPGATAGDIDALVLFRDGFGD